MHKADFEKLKFLANCETCLHQQKLDSQECNILNTFINNGKHEIKKKFMKKMKERTKFLKKIIIQELPINSESFNAIQAKLEKIHHGLAIRD